VKKLKKVGKERKSVTETLGGYDVEIFKMSVRQVIALVKVLEKYLEEIAGAFANYGEGDTVAPGVRFTQMLGSGLVGLIGAVPDDVLLVLKIVIGVAEEDEDWFENDVEYDELIDLVPVLDDLNDFSNLKNRIVEVFDRLVSKYKPEEEEPLEETTEDK
jgi:hypothetical protein